MRVLLRHATQPPGAVAVVVACGALAAVSLVLPYWLSKDEWSWLIWGREVRRLDLQLAGGTVWKPLPVLFTIFISAFRDAAPYLWLALVRAGWLLALVAGYRIGAHLAGRAGGVLGAGALLLTPAHAEWLAYFGRGSAEPLIVALVLWAIDRHLHGRRLQALALASLAALGRPEPWPLVIAYGALIWRGEDARGRAIVLALLATAPALWLGGNWWGAGDPLPRDPHLPGLGEPSPGPAPGLAAAAATDALVFLARFVGAMVIVPVWVAATFAFLRALRAARSPGDEKARVTIALGVAALAWALLVIGDGLLGLPVGSRFLFGPAVLISILGGVGMAQAVQAVSGRWRAMLAVAIAAASLPFAAARAAELSTWMPRDSWSPFSDPPWAEVLGRAQAADRLGACGDEVRVRDMPGVSDPRARAGKFGRAEIAWRLGARLDWVERLSRRRTPIVDRALVLAPAGIPQLPPPGRVTSSARKAIKPGRWRRVAAANGWVVYEVGCRPR
jgi:hypothetical protein